MTDEDLLDEWDTPIPWLFEPLRPIYEDSIREVVFTKKWQKLMGGHAVEADRFYIYNEPETYPILDIHSRYFRDIPSPRDVRIYSSIVSWLGSRGGENFLHDAQRLKPAFERAAHESSGHINDYSDAYLAAWARENTRTRICDDGTPRKMISNSLKDVFGSEANLRDIQIMDAAVQWLGRPGGQIFLQKCQDNIDLKFERERQARLQRMQQPPKSVEIP